VEKSLKLLRKCFRNPVKVVMYIGPYASTLSTDRIVAETTAQFEEGAPGKFSINKPMIFKSTKDSHISKVRLKFVTELGYVIADFAGEVFICGSGVIYNKGKVIFDSADIALNDPIIGVEEYKVEDSKDEEISQTILSKMKKGILRENNLVDRAARVAELHEFLLTMDLEKPCKKSIWERYCKSCLTNK